MKKLKKKLINGNKWNNNKELNNNKMKKNSENNNKKIGMIINYL